MLKIMFGAGLFSIESFLLFLGGVLFFITGLKIPVALSYGYKSASAINAENPDAFDHILCIERYSADRRPEMGLQEMETSGGKSRRKNPKFKKNNDIGKLELVQSKLIQQEKLAGIRRLAAGVAHEINNPLGYVMSNFETLKSYVAKLEGIVRSYGDPAGGNKDSESGKKNCDIDFIINDLNDMFKDMEEGFGRICNIIKDLRLFSGVDQPKRIFKYDLNQGIRNTLQIMQNEIKSHAVIEVELGDIPMILVNGAEINQVIFNIILNAVNAIKECKLKKRGLIKITTYRGEKFICCDIEDNGTGIQSSDLNRIFEPFFTTKPAGQGTGFGFGLSISYDVIVNKYKGEMLVRSMPGKGTVFTVRLPVS